MLLSPVKITSLFILLYGCFHYLELLLYHYIENLDVLFGEVHDPKKLRIHALVVFSFCFFFFYFSFSFLSFLFIKLVKAMSGFIFMILFLK